MNQQQQQPQGGSSSSSMDELYRSQLERAQQLVATSVEGINSLQQMVLQAYRQGLEQQLRVAQDMANRGADVFGGQSGDAMRPLFENFIQAQRQMADAMAATHSRFTEAFNASLRQSGGLVGQAGTSASRGLEVPELMRGAMEQWQRMTQRMMEVAQEQFDLVAQSAGGAAQTAGAAQGHSSAAHQPVASQGQPAAAAAVTATPRRGETKSNAPATRDEHHETTG